MKRVYRLAVLIGIGLRAGTAIIFIGNYFISSQQLTDVGQNNRCSTDQILTNIK